VVLNITNYLQASNRKFLTPDDGVLEITHRRGSDNFMIDIEVPWDEFKQKYLEGSWYSTFSTTAIEQYTSGLFSLSFQFLRDTILSVRFKNASDLSFLVETELSLLLFGMTSPKGMEYKIGLQSGRGGPGRYRLLNLTLRRIRISKSGPLTEIEVEFSITVDVLRFLERLFKMLINKIFGKFADANFLIFDKGNNTRVIKVSLPPTDEPLHPCIGLIFDNTNIKYGLDCTSWLTGAPTIMGSLLSKLTVQLREYLPQILHRIDFRIRTNSETMPKLPIWSVKWYTKEPERPTVKIWTPITQPRFVLMSVPSSIIETALQYYLTQYKDVKFDQDSKDVLESLLQPYPAALQLYNKTYTLSDWNRSDVNFDNFNLKYVAYLNSFLVEPTA
jgi:hypothetical protein